MSYTIGILIVLPCYPLYKGSRTYESGGSVSNAKIYYISSFNVFCTLPVGRLFLIYGDDEE